MSGIISEASPYRRDNDDEIQVDKAPDSARTKIYSDATTNTSLGSIEKSTTSYSNATTNTSFAELEDSADQFRAEQLYDFIIAANKFAVEHPDHECFIDFKVARSRDPFDTDPFYFNGGINRILLDESPPYSQMDLCKVLGNTKDLLANIYDYRKALEEPLGEVARSCDWLESFLDYKLCDLYETPAAIEDAKEFGEKKGFKEIQVHASIADEDREYYLVVFRRFVRIIRRVYGEWSFCANRRILI